MGSSKRRSAKGAAGLMQTEIEGTTPERIPEVERVAQSLKVARYERIDLQAQEQSLERQLVLMKKHGIQAYPIGDKIASLEVTEPKEKIKFTAEDSGSTQE